MKEQILMNNIFFDKLKEEYLDSLTELENKCFSIPWSRKLFEGDISNDKAYYVLVVSDNRVIGYGGLYKVLNEADITNIAVHPDFRRQGLADKILLDIFNHCKSNGIKKIHLEVRESNIPAIRLYEKRGFVKLGERKNYYSDNHETAILMTRKTEEVE
ncbi:MAG: ribosomal protein S18-alanine N-acetyltransferase [Clostridia bacterium]|nr:ribosomal protein S18-alanine N-acetyltransferase [Clostridia bacterium]